MMRNSKSEKQKGVMGPSFGLILIAVLLVAGTVIGLLITQTDLIVEQGEQVADDTREDVSKILQVEGVTGDTDSSNQVEALNITVRGGSENVDLESTTIRYFDDEGSQQLTFNSSGTSDTEYTATAISDEDGSLPILNADDDLVTLEIDLSGSSTPATLQGGDEIEFDVTTESGTTRTQSIEVPDFVESETSIKLK